MKRAALTIVVIAVLLLVLLVYRAIHRATGQNANASPTIAQVIATSLAPPASRSGTIASVALSPADTRKENAAAIVRAVFNAPISFFGRVQDQNGAPIEGAKIEFGAIDKFWESGSNYQATSDNRGLFSISEIKGAGLTVGVSKAGYASMEGFSYQAFGYGMPADSSRKAPPRRDAPAVFVLRKKAEAQPLFAVRRDVILPLNGAAIEVSLKTGKPTEAGRGDIKIECWRPDGVNGGQSHYEWRARISVPGGGLIQQDDAKLDFAAPESGYIASVEISMPQASGQWRADHDANYWLKLPDQTYGRMRLRITTAGDHFASISSYLNPSGSRNLEFDEEKVIK